MADRYNNKQMVVKEKIPERPLEFIRRCITDRQVYWTYHVNLRLKERYIDRECIINSADSYEIIESYPDDKYLPSYLVYGRCKNRVFHVLFATDVLESNVRVVTAYHPSSEEWSEDFKKRKLL